MNAAVAVFVPSLAAMVWDPATEAGTVKPQLNVPVAEEVNEPDVHAEIATVLKLRVSERLGEKPLPEAVTVLPTFPWDGAGETVGPSIENGAEAEFVPSVATTL